MKVLCAPQKVGRGVRDAGQSMRRMRPRVIGMTEMDVGQRNYNDIMRRALGWSVYRWFIQNHGQHSQEVPLFVRIAVFCRMVRVDTVRLSPDVAGRGIGNDRWANVLMLRWFRHRWAFIMVHLNAGVQHVSGSPYDIKHGSPTIDAYIESVQVLERLVRSMLVDPHIGGRVVLMGDFNVLPVGEGVTWAYAPAQLFKRLGLKWVNSRVVYVSWGRGLRLMRHRVILPSSGKNPSDHGWIVAWFRRSLR